MTRKGSRARRPRSTQPRRRALVWSYRAIADLEAIGEYISRDNPAAARRWVQGLLALAETAALMPFVGRRVPEFEREGLREVLQQNYRLVYRVAGDRVEVLTVFEAHRLFPVEVEPPEER